MARPLSDEKRTAILAAATHISAEHGVSGPISKIAKQAGVAEGTVFVYFEDKNALLNALYLAIKDDMAAFMTTDVPRGKDLKARVQHVWDRYIDWGSRHAAQRKAMAHLAVSHLVSDETRLRGAEPFGETKAMLEEAMAGGVLRGQPLDFVGAIMESLAEATLGFVAREPKAAKKYRQAGFDAFWNAIAKK